MDNHISHLEKKNFCNLIYLENWFFYKRKSHAILNEGLLTILQSLPIVNKSTLLVHSMRIQIYLNTHLLNTIYFIIKYLEIKKGTT